MSLVLYLAIYAIVLVWVLIDSHVNAGKISVVDRVKSYVWGTIGAPLVATVLAIWWFIRSFIGVIWKWYSGSNRIQPTYAETDRVKDWIVFPQELIAIALTGRGRFRLKP